MTNLAERRRPLGKRSLLCLLLLGLLAGSGSLSPTYAAKVKMLLGRNTGPYEEVRKSIQSHAGFELEVMYLSGKPDQDVKVVSGFSSDNTSLVVALGTQALVPAAKLDAGIPLVYTLVFDPVSMPGRETSGVLIQIGIKQQLEKLKELFPEREQVGVLFNPSYSQDQVNQAREIADGLGLRLLVVPVGQAVELPAALKRLQAGSAELIWMIADQTIVHPQAVKTIAEFSHKNRLPLIGLSLFHVQSGALAAFTVDFADIGLQTAEVAGLKLAGNTSPAVQKPRKVIVYVSRQVLKRMQLKDMADLPQIEYVP